MPTAALIEESPRKRCDWESPFRLTWRKIVVTRR